MTLGTLKCTTIEDDATPANSITVADLTTLDTDKADLASPTFTGTVTVPATVAFTQNASDVTIPDNQSLALEVKQGDNAYITFDTTNDDERVEVHQNLQLDEDLTFSAAKIVSFPDDNASALRFRQGDNNYIRFNTTDGSERVITEQQLDAHDNIAILARGELQLADTDSNRHIALKCVSELTNTSTWTLPGDTPVAGEVLTVNTVADTHNPTLEWAAVGDATVGGQNTWTAGQRGEITNVEVSSSDITINFDDSNNFIVIVDEEVDTIAYSNLTEGQTGSIFFQYTGDHAVGGWPAATRWAGGTGGANNAPSFTATNGQCDRVDYIITRDQAAAGGNLRVQMVATLNYAD